MWRDFLSLQLNRMLSLHVHGGAVASYRQVLQLRRLTLKVFGSVRTKNFGFNSLAETR